MHPQHHFVEHSQLPILNHLHTNRSNACHNKATKDECLVLISKMISMLLLTRHLPPQKSKMKKVQNETKELNCKQEKDMNTCAKRQQGNPEQEKRML
jgi:hypothetical protein